MNTIMIKFTTPFNVQHSLWLFEEKKHLKIMPPPGSKHMPVTVISVFVWDMDLHTINLISLNVKVKVKFNQISCRIDKPQLNIERIEHQFSSIMPLGRAHHPIAVGGSKMR